MQPNGDSVTYYPKHKVTFPVVTACIAVDDDRNITDPEFLKTVIEKNLEFGFINFFAGKSSTISSCCRLRSDMTQMEDYGYTNSIGGSSTKIGSIGVVSLNLPRIALLAEGDRDMFLSILKDYVYISAKINNAKRHIIRRKIEEGVHPLYTLGFIDLTKQYSTTGINGLYEAVDFMGLDILEQNGQDFIFDILRVINGTNKRCDKLYGSHHNVEQVPGESLSIKFAEKDIKLGVQNKYKIYSNQFIPLGVNADMLDRIKLQGMFDSQFSGGSILHINIENRIEDPQLIVDLLESSIRSGVIYQAINYVLAECRDGHLTVSQSDTCSICGAPIVSKYTRVVGFLSNIKNWHPARRELDFPNRQFY
ncbi:MAG: anaerobic ribonucleoside-triphosphate reductase [Methanosarcina sp.]|nr:anaerobic ribonucleoside-triphosphate reductase [Methanosarcina sp.]